MFKHVLALAFLLPFSSTCHAVTFKWNTLSGDTDRIEFEATIVSESSALPTVRAQLSGNIPIILETFGLIEMSILYSSPGGGRSIAITPEIFDVGIPAFDFFQFDDSEFYHIAIDGLADFGFNGRQEGKFWTLTFVSEEPTFSGNTIVGRFIRVSESGTISLLVLGLVALAFTLRPRRVSSRYR